MSKGELKGKKKDDTYWKFDVDPEKLSSEKSNKKTVPGNRPQLIKNKKPKLEVVENQKDKKSRKTLAREYNERDTLENFVKPGVLIRCLSTIVDYGGAFTAWMVSKHYIQNIYRYYVELLALFKLDQTLPPHEVELNLLIFMGLVVVLTLFLFPIIFLGKPIGKFLFRINTSHSQTGRSVSRGTIILREVILKPLTIVSIYGVYVFIFEKDKISFHDKVAKTVLHY